MPLLQKPGDYEAFERVLAEARQRHPMRILAWCLMPNHWHFVLWPRADGELSAFVRWLTHTHTMRWHAHYQSSGTGHLYQGRFKSFPIQADDHFLTVCRYVERNALRANLAERAEAWRWGSLWTQKYGNPEQRSMLANWPVQRPRNWVQIVNKPQSPAEEEAVRRSMSRGTPYGAQTWTNRVANRLGLDYTLRPRGRPSTKREG
jgi:putative transposase